MATMVTSALVFFTFQGMHHVHGRPGPLWVAPWVRMLALGAVGSVLWVLSGLAARRIAAPLSELARVVGDFGAGKLKSRVQLRYDGTSEISGLAAAFNDMAARIETQFQNQKELLGAVSHELRTPLARMRVLLEMLRETGADGATIAKVEREIIEMDALVGELLAGARVDAGALSKRELDVADVTRECAERAGQSALPIHIAAGAERVHADATLLSRALVVLLDNAAKHGGSLVQMGVSRQGDRLRFSVEDDGPGFDASDLQRLFTPFARGRGEAPDEGRGVGLGLYLVRRIAEAHGGTAFAENRASGGACVGFSVAAA
jgi:signal transduction histidine kinase